MARGLQDTLHSARGLQDILHSASVQCGLRFSKSGNQRSGQAEDGITSWLSISYPTYGSYTFSNVLKCSHVLVVTVRKLKFHRKIFSSSTFSTKNYFESKSIGYQRGVVSSHAQFLNVAVVRLLENLDFYSQTENILQFYYFSMFLPIFLCKIVKLKILPTQENYHLESPCT